MEKELLFFASVEGRGGYEHHAREVMRHLYRKGVKIQLIDLPFHTRRTDKDVEIEEIIEKSRSYRVSNFTSALWICTPSSVRYIPGRQTVSYSTWEADALPPLWVEKLRMTDLNIVTNNFLKNVWIDSGVPYSKVEVVGEGVNLDVFNPEKTPLPLKWRGKLITERFKYRFLVSAELSNRKNVRSAVEAFIKAFEGREDVCLILKVAKLFPEKNIEWYLRDLDLTKAYVLVYGMELPELLVPNFYAVATHYFTMSRGEGWDLNCVQMGAMKKIIIAPFHTAYMDYLSDDRAFLIKKVKKVEAEQDGFLAQLFKGTRWFEPDTDEAVEMLRLSVSNETEANKKAERFYEYIKQNLTWEKQVEKLIDIFVKRHIF